MISKLESVKGKLEYTLSVLGCADIRGANASLQGAREDVITALAELNEVMEKLKDKKLPEKMVSAFRKKAKQTRRCKGCNGGEYSEYCNSCIDGDAQPTENTCMRAAINIIRGK